MYLLSPTGQLNLIKLSEVNCKSRNEMQAIGALCLLLKDVNFISLAKLSSDDLSLTSVQLRALMSSPIGCWPKV